jgi:hypothetical protein
MSNSIPEFDADEMAFATASPRKCPPVDVLMAYGQDVLPVEAERAVEAHLATCALCTMLREDMSTLAEVPLSTAQQQRIRAAIPATTPHGKTGRPWWLSIAVAASVLVCFAAGAVAYRRTHETVVAVSPVSAVPTTVAALEIPLRPLPAPQEAALVTRGAHRGDDPSIPELMPAFTAYNAGNYRDAATRFARLEGEYPRSEMVRLYLGVAQLFVHEDAAANASIASARSLPGKRFTDAERWYGAVAAQRLHSGEAKTLLDGLCADTASAYSAESCRLAPSLH